MVVPDLLSSAGIAWRWAFPDDLRFVIGSWLESREKPFLRGDCQPFRHLAKTVDDAQHRGNVPLLKRIYYVEMPRLIRATLEADPRVLVVYDVDVPTFILGWGHRHRIYVKQAFRSLGLELAIAGAIRAIDEQAETMAQMNG